MYVHLPKRRRARKRKERLYHKRQLQQNATPYVLDAAVLYKMELETVLRVLATWLAKRGWCPTVRALVEKKCWSTAALRRYLQDAGAAGYVVQNQSRGWMLTLDGWAAIRYEPIQPRLPTDSVARRAIVREARRLKNLESRRAELEYAVGRPI